MNKINKTFGAGESDLTNIDIEFYIMETCMSLVLVKFKGPMIDFKSYIINYSNI